MSNVVIDIEGVSKLYRIGNKSNDSITDYFNNLISGGRKYKDFLALDNVSLTVSQGDILGIIGKNGAGKSTMLKLISRITYPTSGHIKMTGRVASLLEVGTGFHPELTGRENIFLNGSILGMTRAEIKSRFDAIVDFSGTEKFLDTPVKHYSSGMYVRLAFSVAAHLEADILIIDEVLAVGDAEFQKKCLGRMKDVSNQGKTVVFVSHNINAVRSLCSRGIVLQKGQKLFDGSTSDAIERYMGGSVQNNNQLDWTPESPIASDSIRLHRIAIEPAGNAPTIYLGDSFSITFELECLELKDKPLDVTFTLSTQNGTVLFSASSYYSNFDKSGLGGRRFCATCQIPPHFLNEGTFIISKLLVFTGTSQVMMELLDCFSFNVQFTPETIYGLSGRKQGALRPLFDWNYTPLPLDE